MLLQFYNYYCRNELTEGDKFLIRNISKEKKIPGTKSQRRYLGPFIATNVTEKYVTYTSEKHGKKVKKVAIHLSKKYFSERSHLSKPSKHVKKKSQLKKQVDLWIYGIETDEIVLQLNIFKDRNVLN